MDYFMCFFRSIPSNSDRYYLERLEFFLLFLIESVESNQTKCFSMQISVEIEEAVVNSARRVALFNFVAGGQQVHCSSSRYTALLHYYGVSQSNNETKFPREAIESPKVVLESVWIKTRSMLSKKALSSLQLFIYYAKSPNNSRLFYFLSLRKRVKCSRIIIIRPKP